MTGMQYVPCRRQAKKSMLITAWLAAQELQELLTFHQRVQVGLVNTKISGRPRISLENPESNTLEPSQQQRIRMKSMPKRASDEKLQKIHASLDA